MQIGKSWTASDKATHKIAGLRRGAYVPPANEAPAIVGSPAISGTAQVGQVLTASGFSVTGYPGPTVAYQWQEDVAGNGTWSNISGATSSSYTLQAAQAGDRVRYTVTASNGIGSPATANSAASALITTAPVAPSISSVVISDTTPTVGDTLTASISYAVTGTAPMTETFAWFAGASPVGTGSSYEVQPEDEGLTITVDGTASNAAGADTDTSAATSAVAAAAAAPPDAPTLTHTSAGDDLTPAFDLTYTGAQAGDALAVYINSTTTLPGSPTTTETLDPADITGGPLVIPFELTELTAGTYYLWPAATRGSTETVGSMITVELTAAPSGAVNLASAPNNFADPVWYNSGGDVFVTADVDGDWDQLVFDGWGPNRQQAVSVPGGTSDKTFIVKVEMKTLSGTATIDLQNSHEGVSGSIYSAGQTVTTTPTEFTFQRTNATGDGTGTQIVGLRGYGNTILARNFRLEEV